MLRLKQSSRRGGATASDGRGTQGGQERTARCHLPYKEGCGACVKERGKTSINISTEQHRQWLSELAPQAKSPSDTYLLRQLSAAYTRDACQVHALIRTAASIERPRPPAATPRASETREVGTHETRKAANEQPATTFQHAREGF